MVIYIYRGKKGTRELGVLLARSCRTLGDFGMRWGKYVGTVFFFVVDEYESLGDTVQ